MECVANKLPAFTLGDVTRQLFILVVHDRYSEFPKYIPTCKTASRRNGSLFLHSCLIPFGTPLNILTGNGKQFKNSCNRFDPIFGAMHLTATACDPHINGRMKTFKRHQSPDFGTKSMHHNELVTYMCIHGIPVFCP